MMLSLQSDNRLHHHQQQQHQLQISGCVGYSRVLYEADRDDAFVMKSEQKQQQQASGSHEDSHGFTPLHLASARPSISMVKQLLDSNDEACMVQDNEGRTPLHLAATKDRVNIIKVLMAQKPEAIHIQNSQYETILHLCVKHDSLNALKLLVEQLPSMAAPVLNINALSINSTNSDGNTILHLAAQMKRMKFIEYLVESKNIGIDIDIPNTNGDKALHMLPEMKDNLEIGCYVSSKEEEEEGIVCNDTTKKANASRDQKWMIEKVNALMVVATLVAGIAFQAAMNPPGGVLQEQPS